MEQKERIRTSISPLGLNTSTPDNVVEDGSLEVCHNLRFANGAWRNVQEFEVKSSAIPSEVGEYSGIHIVYKHPEDVDNAYICTARSGGNLCLIRLLLGENRVSLVTLLDDSQDYEYNHFGKILSVGNNTDKLFNYYWLNRGIYTLIDTSRLFASLSYDLGAATRSSNVVVYGDVNQITECIYSNNASSVSMSSTQNDLWRGEMALFVTIEADGVGELYKSAPIIINTAQADVPSYTGPQGFTHAMTYLYEANGNGTHSIEVVRGNNGTHTINLVAYHLLEWYNDYPYRDQNIRRDLIDKGIPYMRLYSPTLHISLPHNISSLINDTGLSYNVKVWATRIYPLFDINRMISASASAGGTNFYIWADKINGYFADNNLFDEPFYLLTSLSISEFVDQGETLTKDYNLTAHTLNQLVHQTLYEATIGYSSLYSNKPFEYNNRWYLTAPYSKIDASILKSIKDTSNSTGYDRVIVETSIDEELYYKKYVPTSGFIQKKQDILIAAPLNSRYVLFANSADEIISSFQLTTAPSLGLSVYVNRSSRALNKQLSYLESAPIGSKPYANIDIDEHEYGYRPRSITYDNVVAKQVNRIQVSSLNSNLSFSYANSYRIGTRMNQILAINSAAIEMSDAKFGEFPIYIFSSEGIYAMQLGTDTLHPSIPAINHDVIINPHTLAVNNAVLYFTEQGLHALSNNGVSLISAPVHLASNRIPDWMYTTQMVYLPEWNEVICPDFSNNRAYVLSLTNNVWSTRIFPEGYFINQSILISDGAIYNTRNEVNQRSVASRSMAMRSNEYLHKWETRWGVLDSNKDGVSTNYAECKLDGAEKVYYYVDNPSFFDGAELYRITPEKTLKVNYSEYNHEEVCIVSDSNPLVGTTDITELKVIHRETGAILGYMYTNEMLKDATVDSRTYYHAVFSFDLSDPFASGGDMMTFGESIEINGDSYYLWNLDTYNTDGDEIQYNRELDAWLSQHDYTFTIGGETESYNGNNTDLRYLFDNPLQAEFNQPKPRIYCTSDGQIYQSDTWDDNVIYSKTLIDSGGDEEGGDEEGGGNEGGDSPLPIGSIVLKTRPIKLGANKELKRLETLIVRFEADQEEELEITIKGSIDGVEYKDLRKVSATTNTDVLIRRTPASVKYLKFVVKSDSLQSSIRLIRFDTEHYLRFVRRMR